MEQLDPDVVIMDLSTEQMDGAAAKREITEKKLRAGGCGSHGRTWRRLHPFQRAARTVAQGIGTKDPLESDRARFERLTYREQKVLRLTAQGYSVPEIGERLYISQQRIRDKLGIARCAACITFCLEVGSVRGVVSV